MNLAEYQSAALKTAPAGTSVERRLIGVLGLVSTAGKLANTMKQLHAFKKSVDKATLVRCIGSALWYLALFADAAGTSLTEAAEENLERLREKSDR